ncbi:MAG TPA: lysophospholipid acyltransferase family protein [Methylomirabilota bacterium]|nr:lysophospholipid acyltransferase family protein [Methylomirabilota bacterium]
MRRAPLWFLEILRPFVWLATRALFRIRFEGVEHVPAAGPVLLTPNHVSYMDPLLITIPVHRPLHYMTLEPFFRVPGLGAMIRWCRAFPVREDLDRQAVRTAIRTLRAGEPLVIFPEGGRSRDGRPLPFRPGAFRIALQTETPVIPVTIAGAFEAWPAHRRLPRPGRVTVTYHAPLTRKDLPPTADRKSQPEVMAELVRDRIAERLSIR